MPPLPGVGARERRLDVWVDNERGSEHSCDEGGRDAVEQWLWWRGGVVQGAGAFVVMLPEEV